MGRASERPRPRLQQETTPFPPFPPVQNYRVWLLFGNELAPPHGLIETLLVLVNREGPVFLEML